MSINWDSSDFIKKVAEKLLERGIDTIVDLDLTDLFFQSVYGYGKELVKKLKKNIICNILLF